MSGPEFGAMCACGHRAAFHNVDGCTSFHEKDVAFSDCHCKAFVAKESSLSPVQEEAPTLDAMGLPRNVENWTKAVKYVADHFNVKDLRDAVAVDYTLRASEALPALLEASRDRQRLKFANADIEELREQLAGSISERETLTAQNEELKKQRDDAFHHASENVDDVKTAYETACDDLHEANETIARLTSRAVEASPSEFQKFCIACGRTLPDENEQLFAWREQAIQDIEALSRYGASSRFPFCEHAHGEYINREAVLLILREAPTT